MEQSLLKDYYVYKILGSSFDEDLSESTFLRRQKKKERSNNHFFLYDLSDLEQLSIDQSMRLKRFLDQNSADALCMTPELYSLIDFGIQKSIHLVIKEPLQFEIYKKLQDSVFASITLQPSNKSDLLLFLEISKQYQQTSFYWQISNSINESTDPLLVKDIGKILKQNSLIKSPLSFFNATIEKNYELESLADIRWQFETKKKNILLSIVIPTFNNALFLSNVLHHLFKQNISAENYEIIVVDDGSQDSTGDIIYSVFHSKKSSINLKYIYWPKTHPQRGQQNFFRAGLARNLGVSFTEGSNLFFLDSDMLVPFDFIENILFEFEQSEVLQFIRYHILQDISLKNPSYNQINLIKDTYIEEKNYWGQLFQTQDWNLLDHKWKYACTYALGMSKSDFYDCGRFKRHFVSYGFEDTDLGFRLYKKNKNFKLIRKPLLHLTNYNLQQYQNSKIKRDQLLQKTAALFFLDHLDLEIYKALEFYFHFQRSL